jgi:hypothetical protein
MRLAENERRAQKLTADESRPRLPFWVEQFYPQMRARSNQGLCLPNQAMMPKCAYGFAMGISSCR